MEFKNYYQILGVKTDVDNKAIKSAYRKLAHKYHPDMNADEKAGEKFKAVKEAYEVLKDPARRAEYDELRQYENRSGHEFKPPSGWQNRSHSSSRNHSQNDADFSDFFNSVFGGSYNQQQGSQAERNFSFKGQDLEIKMPIFLEELIKEDSKKLEYIIPVNENGIVKQIKKSLNVKIPAGVKMVSVSD